MVRQLSCTVVTFLLIRPQLDTSAASSLLFGQSSSFPVLRAPLHLQKALWPVAGSAATGWRRCSGPGPGPRADSGSSCWSTCLLTPPAPEPARSTPWWPPLVAADAETHREREEVSVQIQASSAPIYRESIQTGSEGANDLWETRWDKKRTHRGWLGRSW